MFRKNTWIGQYLHFSSFWLMKYKRSVVQILFHRTHKICTAETLETELATLHRVLQTNAYPTAFIERNSEFKPSTMVKDQVVPQLKDKLPTMTSSMILYEFKCCCAATYIAQTVRQLSKRVKEHVPAWYFCSERKNTHSAILNHLIDTGCDAAHKSSFRVIYRVLSHRSKSIKRRTLSAAEAIAIRLFGPTLCRQKRLTHSLSLPWPGLNHSSTHIHTHAHTRAHVTVPRLTTASIMLTMFL